MSAPPAKKAKIDKQEDDGVVPSAPLLPAEDVAHIFDFLFYEELRSALLCGKFVANDVAKCIRTLTITHKAQLDIPAARRFPNVRNVNILCLVKGSRDRHKLSVDTSRKAIPFVSIFPHLMNVLLGGLDANNIMIFPYESCYCYYPKNAFNAYTAMLFAICGAYQSRLLPPDISFGTTSYFGLRYYNVPLSCCKKKEDARGLSCKFCCDLCQNLPIKDVLSQAVISNPDDPIDYYVPCCLTWLEIIKVIANRPGGRDALKRYGQYRLSNIVQESVARRTIREIKKNSINEHETHHIQCVTSVTERSLREIDDDAAVLYISSSDIHVIDYVIELGVPPPKLDIDFLQTQYSHRGATLFWSKGTIQKLRDRGFTIELDKERQLDENDPSMRFLKDRIDHGYPLYDIPDGSITLPRGYDTDGEISSNVDSEEEDESSSEGSDDDGADY